MQSWHQMKAHSNARSSVVLGPPTRAAAGCMQAPLYADMDKRRKVLVPRGGMGCPAASNSNRNLDSSENSIQSSPTIDELPREAPQWFHVDSVEREEGSGHVGNFIEPPRGDRPLTCSLKPAFAGERETMRKM